MNDVISSKNVSVVGQLYALIGSFENLPSGDLVLSSQIVCEISEIKFFWFWGEREASS